ncbi:MULTISPECIES: hypothetical protein [unclassified Bacillus (in: firmicutes)]|uniref:hypothetical protein n=1 Tax=unclassified Bacillus (in: firmicutes) TaxID=185979 RepID=UPI0008F124C0|nr:MULTISPECIES: hypothetical protein [unclassified Bacillus (in: firmicutes)]SFB03914.1 hypothetical protein SAMN02799634_104242 [Bacillus sp. UNCCL13]
MNSTWKGVSESQVIVVTGQGGGDCGIDFVEGEEYLVYANQSSIYEDSDYLSAGICSRTNELSAAEEDLLVLGEGKAPTKDVDLGKELNGSNLYIWLIAVGIIGVVTFFIWRRFRFRK